MRKLFVTIVLALAITSSLFAAYLGVDAGAGFYTGDVIQKEDNGSRKLYTDDIGFMHVTLSGETLDYYSGVGAGFEVSFEKPFYWMQHNVELDLSDYNFEFKEGALYVSVNSGLYYMVNFNAAAGVYYRQDALATKFGGDTLHIVGFMGKVEVIFDNAAPAILKAGIKMKAPLLSFVSGDKDIRLEAIMFGAYLSLGLQI